MTPPLLLRRTVKALLLPPYNLIGALRSPFRGSYKTWEKACQAIPKNRAMGYGHREAAEMYHGYLDKVRLSDYPVIYWMGRILENSDDRDDSVVFDLGGHVGMAYYSFAKYIGCSERLKWIVCDLPEITRRGQELAEQRKITHLSFTQHYADGDGAEVLLAAGSLQCMETPLSSMLASFTQKPKHLLINRIPLYDGDPFFTTQDVGPVVVPYQVFQKKCFIASLCDIGYHLMDSWEITEPFCGPCIIPFHPDKQIQAYHGLYFRYDSAFQSPYC